MKTRERFDDCRNNPERKKGDLEDPSDNFADGTEKTMEGHKEEGEDFWVDLV